MIEPDIEKKLYVIKYLKAKGYKTMYTDWFLAMDRETGKLQFYSKNLKLEDVQKYLVHHPDIMVLDGRGQILFLVEIDEVSHHTRSGARKTEKRDRHYAGAGLDVIVIDEYGLGFLKMSWEDCIDKELKRING